MGVLEWSPKQFWKATPRDLSAALDGWNEKNGNGGSDHSKRSLPKAEIDELRQLIAEEPKSSGSIKKRNG